MHLKTTALPKILLLVVFLLKAYSCSCIAPYFEFKNTQGTLHLENGEMKTVTGYVYGALLWESAQGFLEYLQREHKLNATSIRLRGNTVAEHVKLQSLVGACVEISTANEPQISVVEEVEILRPLTNEKAVLKCENGDCSLHFDDEHLFVADFASLKKFISEFWDGAGLYRLNEMERYVPLESMTEVLHYEGDIFASKLNGWHSCRTVTGKRFSVRFADFETFEDYFNRLIPNVSLDDFDLTVAHDGRTTRVSSNEHDGRISDFLEQSGNSSAISDLCITRKFLSARQ